ncbi:MAG: DNA primase [Streptomyces sp.]|nr:DNA primase [Streptomyces sp.]
MNRVGLGLAVGAGYVLGRTKKMKMAFAVGSLVAGKRMHLSPRALADLVSQQLQNNPQFKEIGDQLREDLRGVGKAASGAMVERQIDALADRLHGRTSLVRDQLSGATDRAKGLVDDEEEDEAPEEDENEESAEAEGEDSRDEYDDEEPADEERDVDEPEGEDEPASDEAEGRPARKTAKKAAKKAPAKKTAAKRSPAKKAPAKKAASKQATAKKSAAKRTAARKTAPARGGSGDTRARRPKGGGER